MSVLSSLRLLWFAIVIAPITILAIIFVPEDKVAAEATTIVKSNVFAYDSALGVQNSFFVEPSPSPTPEKEHLLVASYYDVENFPSAKLLLNNKDMVAREVRPTLYNLDGLPMTVPPILVEPNSARMIDLREWADLGGTTFRRGSLKLSIPERISSLVLKSIWKILKAV